MPRRDTGWAHRTGSILSQLAIAAGLWIVGTTLIDWMVNAAPGTMVSIGLLAIGVIAMLVGGLFYVLRD